MYDNKFSLDSFKKWMRHHPEQRYTIERPSYNGPIGCFVESKIDAKRIVSKITSENDNIEQMAKDFMENGGKVLEVNGLNLLIEVSSGNFYLKRAYCRKISAT